MSGIHLVPGSEGLESEFINFPDLEEYLKSNFEKIRDLSDLDSFMELLANYLRSDELNSDQKRSLKALRQKGYDRKSKLKRPNDFILYPPPAASSTPQQEEIDKPGSKMGGLRIEKKYHANKIKRFQVEASKHVKQIFLMLSAMIVGYLLWLQSISLYKASGFDSPELVAFTGIIMVIGFSIYHAHSRSWLALICCIYIGAYETYFIASGTFSDEANAKVSSPEIVQQKNWYLENIQRAKDDYQELKERYENPGDKIFQNAWFKKKHLDPAWGGYSAAQKEFAKFKNHILDRSSGFDHVGWLKVLFRLGLVGLFMMNIHQVAMHLQLSKDK
ncbi:MAG: hypothetical protein AB8G05_05645 [Oligoflexales bacterium]